MRRQGVAPQRNAMAKQRVEMRSRARESNGEVWRSIAKATLGAAVRRTAKA
jgi:hypothetical protein